MAHLTKAYNVTPAGKKKGFRIHLLVFLLVTPIVWLVWFITNNNYPWPIWQTAAWATGILFHYSGVYVSKSKIIKRASRPPLYKAGNNK